MDGSFSFWRYQRDATSDGGRRQWSGAALGLSLDRAAGLRPAGEADREVGDVRESHLARHVRRAGNEAELAALTNVADVHHLDVAAGHLGLDLLHGQVLDPRLGFLDHLADGLSRLPRGHGHIPQDWIVAPAPASGKPLGAVKRPR